MAEPKIAIDILVNCQTGTNNLKRFNRELDKTVVGATRASKATNWLATGFKRLFVGYLGIQGVRNIVNTYRKLDLIRQSLNGLAGGAEAGARQFEYLRNEADRTATDFTTIAEKYKNFYAAASGAGFGEQQTQTMFSGLLTAGRALGADKQSIGGALLAVEQMLSKGKVSMEELRRQLGNAYAGAIQVAARAMGVAPEQFEVLLKKGIKSKEFVPKLTAQFEKEFKEGLKEAVKSLDAEMVKLGNAWQYMILKLGDNGVGKELAELIRKITLLLSSPQLLNTIQIIGKTLNVIMVILGYLIDNIGTILMFLAPYLLGGALVKLLEILKGIVTWVTALNTSLTLTQKFMFRIMFILILLQEIVAFFTDKDGLLETALLGKDQSWLGRLSKIVFALTTLGALFGLGGGFGKFGFGGATKGVKGAKQLSLFSNQAMRSSGAKMGIGRAITSNPYLVAGAAALGASYAGTQSIAKMGINPMTINPYGMSQPFDLTKIDSFSPNITYNPQYKIDATTMTPEQLKNVLDERDKSFWSSLVSGQALNKIGVQR